VHSHEIESGVIYRDANVKVIAFLVKHGSWKQAYGYRFESADRVIVFSGDTAPSENVEEMTKGADILVHEVYEESEAKPENRPGGEEWPKYMRAFHTSARELGAICARGKPKLLILNHVLMRQGSEDQLISQIKDGGFLGKVVIGKDLAVY
jgi:ribonuclease Z